MRTGLYILPGTRYQSRKTDLKLAQLSINMTALQTAKANDVLGRNIRL